VGLVLNYREHADELGLRTEENPILFIKPNSSLIGHLGDIVYPATATHVHYEAELAVVIGKKGRRIGKKQAMKHVAGYTIANDMTARDFITNTFRPPVKAKGFDTFCPLGPWVTSADEIPDPHSLELTTRLNGNVVQHGNTSMFIHSIPEIIEFISEFMTLMPDDLILTGTPKGITPVHPGDKIDISIEGIGTLSNRVVADGQRKQN
jgi:5-oxopent-3-ene-1,2,5-tricarboxylate decarboxylase/2-hydroxyhepta-2,4-diene-1,7-dioate isomerase